MIRIELPWPSRSLSPNARKHWAELSRAKKQARADGYQCAVLHGVKNVRWKGVNARYVFHPPDKRKRDDDNLMACMKAYRDGIADAMGVDDNTWNLKAPMIAHVEKGGKVIVEVWPGD